MAADEERKPSRVIPVLVAALLCDVAVQDFTGKKSLIGIFDRLWAGSFPTTRPMFLYFKIADAEGDYRVTARFVHADKNEIIAEARGEISVQDRLSASDYLLEFPPLLFPQEGRYEFHILMNDAYLGRAFIDAARRPEPEQRA